jgi:hypothetical protein
MGGYHATGNNIVQTISLGTNVWILRSSLAYFKGQKKEYIYSWSEKALLHAFLYDRTADTLDVVNAIISGVHGPNSGNGSFFSLSSDNSVDSTAVLWVNQSLSGNANQSVCVGILRAFSATDVTKELWNSSMSVNDEPGYYSKFNCPTIANGKVYLATFSNKLVVYGLRTPIVNDSCNSVNIALHKPATASTQESLLAPSAAFDGNLLTRWGSGAADPQYIYTDLGSRYDICKVILKWEVALAKDFEIQLSEDAVNWTTIKKITGNTVFENYLRLQGSGRYIRMLGTARGTTAGYSLWEFEVYGSPSSNQIIGSHEICPGASTSFQINTSGITYQWQSDNGSGFFDIADNSTYTGAATPTLQLNNVSSSRYGYQYRCVVDGVSSNPVSLIFSDTWVGSADNSWENPSNWSCGILPDANTNVIVNNGTVILNSNTTIRSLKTNTGVNFTVRSHFTFTINH